MNAKFPRGPMLTHETLADRLRPGPNGCMEWALHRNANGYGVTEHGGRCMLAHRVAWIVAHGPIPRGMYVLHRCDNRPCCNVEHLWLGTHAENAADMVAKGRQARGIRAGMRRGQAKLSAVARAEIVRRHGEGEKYARLASEYGISDRQTRRIVADGPEQVGVVIGVRREG
jgi:hypothetical protein